VSGLRYWIVLVREDGEVATGFAHRGRVGDDNRRAGTESIIEFAGKLGVDSKAFAEVVESGDASGPIGVNGHPLARPARGRPPARFLRDAVQKLIRTRSDLIKLRNNIHTIRIYAGM